MRITPVDPGTRPELAELEARITAARGRVSPLYGVLLNSPPIAHGWEQMLSAIRNHSTLPADLRELVILRVAVLNGAQYEFDAHEPIALAAGVPEKVIRATRQVPLSHGSDLPSNVRLVLDLTDAMTRDLVVPEPLFAAVRLEFTPQQQLDLVATVAAYNMVSRLLIALEIGH